MKRKTQGKRFEVTPKGILSKIDYDAFILYMIRLKYNGIVLEDGELNFVNLKKGKK